MQAKSDIAQGAPGNQYNTYGAGKNDVGWFVTADNDGAFNKTATGTSAPLLYEVDQNGNDTMYKNAKLGFYNILGLDTTNVVGTDITDRKSPFGRFSKGIISSTLRNKNGPFKNDAQEMYFRYSTELRSKINAARSENKPIYFAITFFGSNWYNGQAEISNSKLQLSIRGLTQPPPGGLATTYQFDYTRPPLTTLTNRKWFTKVYKLCNYVTLNDNASNDFKIRNTTIGVDDIIHISTIEIFIGEKPDYYTDGNPNTAGYYAYPAAPALLSTDPFDDANIVSLNCTEPEPLTNKKTPSELFLHAVAVSWELYPNPATNHTYIKIHKAYQSVNFTIRDMMGKTLQSKSLSNIAAGSTIPIDLSGYAKGVYLVYLQLDGSGESVKKLVVE